MTGSSLSHLRFAGKPTTDLSDREVLIRLDDICVRFEERNVLEHIFLDIKKGDFLAVSGPNGGGKTTLLKVLLKLLKPTKGKVEYYKTGKVVKHLPIGYLPQKSMIDTHFPIDVATAVKSGMISGLFGRYPADADIRFNEVVELCGIGDYLSSPVGVLSGGQLQRTLMARALISNPEVIVLDEPLSYVDKQFEHQIYSIMETLARTKTIILVSHEMSVISGMANRHIIIDHTLSECHRAHHGISRQCDPSL